MLLLELIHPLPSLATTMAGVAFAIVFGIHWPAARLVLIGVTILATQFSISALNDWADRDRDAAAGRWRPVAMARLAPSIALGLAMAFALGVIPGLFLDGSAAAAVLVVGLAAGWAYDLWLKPTPLSFLPFAVAFPLLPTWVGLVAGRHFGSFAVLIVGGAILAVAIHLSDSLPDIAADAAAGLRTLAVALGSDRSVRAIMACLLFGGFVAAITLRSQPLLAGATGIVTLVAAGAVGVVARRQPQSARWIAGGCAVVAALGLVARLPNG